ncbi:MAG TPA: argininosuccinate synthase [bacterium]|mgnify:CR=1 FL=1|nr:argininosuccinate synthase [bacterium]HPN43281.1 argininosuccinate synthase [bacterium]
MTSKVKKVVLAYSGGLDTSIIIPWLKENYGCEVIAFAADLGQGQELNGLEEKAIATGASKCYIEDLRKPFVEEYIWPTLKAGAIYEEKYLLGTSFARPIIAKRQVEIANAEGADAVAHGCTGKGNDQVRFELTYKAFNPKLRVIAPWREWNIRSREDAIAYAEERKVPITASKEKIYSNDRNIWHISHEGGDLENPWNAPKDEMFVLTKSPQQAPDKPTTVEIEFYKGVPIAVNGTRMDSVQLVQLLNVIGGENAIGRIDLVENRLVGMKSRGVYECPAGTILYRAHQELESLVLDREIMHFKEMLAPKYAELVYYGEWYTPLREALDAFVESTQQNVTGTVRFQLYKGNVMSAGVKSPYSLYREELATFGKEDVYDQTDAKGFINLFGLPIKVRSLVELDWGRKAGYNEPDYTIFKRD